MAPATVPEDWGSSSDESDVEDHGSVHGEETALTAPHEEENVSYIRGHARVFALAGEELPSETTAGSEEVDKPQAAKKMAARAYQLEMLEQALKRNVIVTMDTGSGKTQVAVLRVKAELDTGPTNKLVWFLAPTVALCAQQFQVLQAQTQAVSMKLLTGNENVDSWSAKTWMSLLEGVRVVVSTYQVLLDALSHAFVRMEALSLIVFDEAHNCVGRHPGSRIMIQFYHPAKKSGAPVPAILGLTASPSMRSNVDGLEMLEATLDARCLSPTLHREEVIKFVKKPQVCRLLYEPSPAPHVPSLLALCQLHAALDIRQDPWILSLTNDPSISAQQRVARAIEKSDTWAQNQLKGLVSRGTIIADELGAWAAQHYLHAAITRFLGRPRTVHDQNQVSNVLLEEERYLADILSRIPLSPPTDEPAMETISPKTLHLIDELLASHDSIGIIFVTERATVSTLQSLLCHYPPTRDKFRIGAVVGASTHGTRSRNIFDFPGDMDLLALHKFRTNKVDLLVATSVLEEGIDVPACNLVICFDLPATPKSFIQRRGRARMLDSRLVLLMDATASDKIQTWTILEGEMERMYQDDERTSRSLEELEDSEEAPNGVFVVEATGATLDFDNAKSHLAHFCTILSHAEFTRNQPDYVIHQHPVEGEADLLSATVLLPLSVPSECRTAESAGKWRSEKNATKDTAFQAYKALYLAGLVDDNLLPFRSATIPGVETREAAVPVDAPFQPWAQIAEAWTQPGPRWVYTVEMRVPDHGIESYDIALPTRLDRPRPLPLYLKRDEMGELIFGEGVLVPDSVADQLPDHTSLLLALNFAHRWPIQEKPHVIKAIIRGEEAGMHQIGTNPVHLPVHKDIINSRYLIRQKDGVPFTYRGLLPSKPPMEQVQKPFHNYEDGPLEPYIDLSRWTRRTDFLHPILSDVLAEVSQKPYSTVVPISWAKVDSVAAGHAQFGMLLPSVIHTLESMLVARQLALTILKPLGLINLKLVQEAISTPSACEPFNYEHLEFIGDSLLKFFTAVQVFADHPEWPESYLSFFKDRIVANSRLSRAALETGLPKYIISKGFTGHKWRPLYVDNFLQPSSAAVPKRALSTKVLADVVEALIGASYKDGGDDGALKCISIFIDEIEWRSANANREMIYAGLGDGSTLPAVLEPLERLIGYRFKKKSLLVEAMTHASYVSDANSRSLERLEFLGDAVLDYIIVSRFATEKPQLHHGEMHMLKTCMVNADFLAFVVLNNAIPRTETVVSADGTVIETEVRVPLWKFMRHAVTSLGIEQTATEARYEAMRDDMIAGMTHGTHYPWATLARLQPKKFFSDLFEAVVGALWVDSGSIASCRRFVSRFGILPYLDRMLREGVGRQHPKEALVKLAQTEKVKYDYAVVESADGEKEWRCRLFVGPRFIAAVAGGLCKEEIMTKAAEAAVSILRAESTTNDSDEEMVM